LGRIDEGMADNLDRVSCMERGSGLIDVHSFAAIEARIDAIAGGVGPLAEPARCQTHVPGEGSDPVDAAAELLALGERVLEAWIIARGKTPSTETREGFRLLALHRQGAKGEPSFNACRETCRELVYHNNLIAAAPAHPETPRRLVLMAMVARHLALFVGGKLEVAGLGEFCCSSKPLRREVNSK